MVCEGREGCGSFSYSCDGRLFKIRWEEDDDDDGRRFNGAADSWRMGFWWVV